MTQRDEAERLATELENESEWMTVSRGEHAALLRSMAAEIEQVRADRDSLYKAWEAAFGPRSFGEVTDEIERLQAALQSQAAPRTLLEQYDLDQSPEYRKGYQDGRFKGYEVGHRYATEALQSQAAAHPVTPAGFALVPIRATRAMEDVFAEEGWEWANVLAAAEAVTLEQYEDALSTTPPDTQAVLHRALEVLKDSFDLFAREQLRSKETQKVMVNVDAAITELEAMG